MNSFLFVFEIASLIEFVLKKYAGIGIWFILNPGCYFIEEKGDKRKYPTFLLLVILLLATKSSTPSENISV